MGEKYNTCLCSVSKREDGRLTYFVIETDSTTFDKIKEEFGKELIFTWYSELAYVADCDDAWIENFASIIEEMDRSRSAVSRVTRRFLDVLMPIKDIKILNEIQKYTCHMNDQQRRCIQSRIDVLNGKQDVFQEEMNELVKSLACDIKTLRRKTGMSLDDFAKYFDIPSRVVENWEEKKTVCDSYLYKLMEKELYRNGLIRE